VPTHSRDDEPSRALVITGGLGSGKTSVAIDLAAVLDGTQATYALIDLDFLCWAKPSPDCPLSIHDLLVMNLVPVVRGFQSAGVRHFLLPRLILTNDEARELRAALAEATVDDVTIVELTVSASTALTRLEHRDHGATLAEHQRLVSSLIPEAGISDISFSTENASISDVARQVLQYWDIAT
jgi:hypothetical protein